LIAILSDVVGTQGGVGPAKKIKKVGGGGEEDGKYRENRSGKENRKKERGGGTVLIGNFGKSRKN